MVLTSSRLSLSEPILPAAASTAASETFSRLSTVMSASERAKAAMASSRKEMPSSRSIEPKVKRVMSEEVSWPMVASPRPRKTMSMALRNWPRPAKAETAVSPRTMSAK